MILTPVIAGTANLDTHASAVPLEMFISLIGIVMLTPVFQPEQNTDIDDLVSSKYINITKIYFLRTVCSTIIIMVSVILFSAYMAVRGCDITLLLMIGTLADAVFLGSLGMITSSICGSTVVAYMIPAVFYALNFGMGSQLKNFYLFSMSIGQYSPKFWMLATGILLIVASVIFKDVQKKYR